MKKNKLVVITLIVTLILLAFNMFYSIYEYIDLEKRKQSGDEHWLQIEDRINIIEKEVEELKKEVYAWKK